MPYKGLPEDLVRCVNPLEARRYAASAGWQRLDGFNGRVAVYTHPGAELDQLLIPLDASIEDYGPRMAEVVANLAAKENRSPQAVLNDLLLPPADVLRFRQAGPEADKGLLPLEQTINLLAGARKALLAAACSVVRPQPYHPRLSRTEAEQFVRACRVGQTERGSFTVTLACPLDAVPSETGLFEQQPPFTRKVTALLMQSVRQIGEAVDADQVDTLLDPARAPDLSANLCEALLAMRPAGERATLSISSTWARTLPPPAGEGLPGVVILRQEYFPAIELLTTRLRPLPQPRRDLFVGFVDVLKGEPGPDDRPQGEVIVTVLHEDEMLRVRLDLSADDYGVAGAAHLEAELVRFEGVLRRGPRLGRVDEVTDFIRLQRPR